MLIKVISENRTNGIFAIKIKLSKMMKLRGLNKLRARRIYLLIILILPIIYCKGQSNSKEDSVLAPRIKFEHDTIDYGIIPRNSNPYRYIKLSNIGKEPLLITVFGDVAYPVRCPQGPIEPGQTAEIEIGYPTDKVGPFTNFIGINSNAIPRQNIIYVKGWVLHAVTDAPKK